MSSSGARGNFFRIRSRALAALLVFAAIGGAVGAYCRSGNFDRFQANPHQWAWWAIDGYRQRPVAPQVVMIGSSLLQKIVNEGEVEYLHKPVLILGGKRSRHFEDEYQQQTRQKIDSYALAIGGMHASDAAVLFDGVIAEKTPRTLIYFMAPRDVLDNILETPVATDTFKLVSRISDTSSAKARCRRSFKEIFVGFVDDGLQRLSPWQIIGSSYRQLPPEPGSMHTSPIYKNVCQGDGLMWRQLVSRMRRSICAMVT